LPEQEQISDFIRLARALWANFTLIQRKVAHVPSAKKCLINGHLMSAMAELRCRIAKGSVLSRTHRAIGMAGSNATRPLEIKHEFGAGY
jgi:hypothetical protein